MTRRSRDVAEKVEKCIGNPIVKKMTQKLASKENNSSKFYPKELIFLQQTRFLEYKQNLFFEFLRFLAFFSGHLGLKNAIFSFFAKFDPI